MSRTGAMLLIALLIAVGGLVALARGDRSVAPAPLARGQEGRLADGGVWVGAVLRDGTLLPFAQWLDDSGWRRWPFFDRLLPAPRTLADAPAGWLPTGMMPPTRWIASFAEGRRAVVQLRPTVQVHDLLQTLVLETDAPVAAPHPGVSWAALDTGLAVAGDARLRPFREVPQAELTGVLRFANAAMSQAEAGSLSADVRALINEEMRRRVPTEIETAVATATADGRREFYVEGMRTYADYPGECKPLVRLAIAVEERGSVMRLVDSGAAATDTCGHYVAHVPLAVLERGAARCWVVRRVYEDGVDYTLTAPGKGASDAQDIECALGQARQDERRQRQ